MAIRTRQYTQKIQQANLWLGQPATAQGLIPSTAGIKTPRYDSLLLNTPGMVNPRSRYTYVEMQNRGTASAGLALVGFLPDAYWGAGQWTDATTTYTDDTLDAQDADTNDFVMEVAATINDGFVVGATIPFGAMSIDVTTASSGTTPTRTIEFWNGSAWTALSTAAFVSDIARSVEWAAGEALVLFDPPPTWAKGGSGTAVPQDRYNVRIKRTNAVHSTAALARRIYLGVVLASIDAVAANGSYVPIQGGVSMDVPDYLPYVSVAIATADAGNNITVIADTIENA